MQNPNTRTVKIDGHITSVFLEEEFWIELKKISELQNISSDQLISTIDQDKSTSNLASAIRLYVLNHLKNSS